MLVAAIALALVASVASAQPVTFGPPTSITVLEAQGGQASINLLNATAELLNTSDTAWTLSKNGVVDGSTQLVTWTVTATRGSTTSNKIFVNGYMSVSNTGSATASIGNIVVNLQTKNAQNKWVTRSSDIANATAGDAATTAKVVAAASSENLSMFSENGASGTLMLTDAASNSEFSLVPQPGVAPGATVNLYFSATYDNSILALPVGSLTRSEIIVSFGNAGNRGNGGSSGQNIDINGNGVIDADEASVRSVPTRITRSVPAAQSGNGSVTLTDGVGDITTTGTVSFSGASTTVGGGSGSETISATTTRTVTATADGGAEGGTIGNCAHLAGSTVTQTINGHTITLVVGVDLDACDTQTIEGDGCVPGQCCGPDCGWKEGDVFSYTQVSWGDNPDGVNIATVLANNFSAVYPLSFVEVGIPGAGGFSVRFTSAAAINTYQPSTGPAGALTGDLVDPVSTSSGTFGGDVLALRLNIDFSDAGLTGGNAGIAFGDLTLCNLTDLVLYEGLTVRDFYAIAGTALGGGNADYTYAQLDAFTQDVNASFQAGVPNAFAQDHLCQ
jgi:hypothetical protein